MNRDHIDLAFEAWWNELSPEQQVSFDRRSCWLGFLAGGSFATKYVGEQATQIFGIDYTDRAQGQEDDDPTPWCAGCGAMTAEKCDCGPIADHN